jgi:hypothetical protein
MSDDSSFYSEISGAPRDNDVTILIPLNRAEANRKSWDDDSNWKGLCGASIGCIYYGKDDSRLCVRRRCVRLAPPFLWLGTCQKYSGCSVNVSHRYGCATLIGVILLFFLGEGVSWAVTIFKEKL